MKARDITLMSVCVALIIWALENRIPKLWLANFVAKSIEKQVKI